MAKKRKIKPMDEETVRSHVMGWVNDALDYNTSELAQKRADALKYYLGEPLGNERPGKSKVVSRDIQETIDWIMPSLMKVFTSGDSVVQYEPQSQEDIPLAEQETEYINYLFTRKNKGFLVLHDWFQDALMMKTGIVKVWVEDVEKPRFDYFTGLDEDQVLEILAEPEVELLARTDREDGFIDIKIKSINTRREIKVGAVPPEEFLIDRDAKCIESARFAAHRTQMTVSQLRLMGVPEDVLEELPYDEFDQTDASPERLARLDFDGTGVIPYASAVDDEASRKIWVTECYCNLDVDGDGFAELRKITIAGEQILFDEETPCKPFADLTAHRIAHKFHGMSIFDKIKDIQEIRSSLMRSILDNVNRLNTGRYAVVEGSVNLDDLMTNDAAGIVRMKTQGAVQALDNPQLSGDVYNMLDRLENDRGKRTGVTDRSRGLDANTLHSNQAATSVNQMMTAAEQQIDLIARMFAETGVRNLFQLLHDFAIRYQDQEEMFQLRGQFVKVNPSSWRERLDLSVTVGIGNMNKDQQLLHISRMFEMAQAVINGGGMGVLVNEKNIYNMLKELSKNAGYKDVSRFWTDPDSPEAQEALKKRAEAEQKPSPEEIKAQADMARAQADAQAKQAEAQLRMAEIQLKQQELQVKLREMSLKEEELSLERDRFTWERAKNEAEFTLERDQQRTVALGDGKVPEVKKRRKASAE